MKIQVYEPQHLGTLKAIHAKRGLPPACFPDADNPLFFIRRVIEKDGKAAAAAFVKLTCEPFLLLDPDLRDREAKQYISILADVVEAAVRKHGIEDATVWLPPSAETEGFVQVLEQIGFKKSPWQSYSQVLSYKE